MFKQPRCAPMIAEKKEEKKKTTGLCRGASKDVPKSMFRMQGHGNDEWRHMTSNHHVFCTTPIPKPQSMHTLQNIAASEALSWPRSSSKHTIGSTLSPELVWPSVGSLVIPYYSPRIIPSNQRMIAGKKHRNFQVAFVCCFQKENCLRVFYRTSDRLCVGAWKGSPMSFGRPSDIHK